MSRLPSLAHARFLHISAALLMGCAASALCAAPALAQGAPASPGARNFAIRGQALVDAMREFSRVTGIQVAYTASIGSGVQSPGVSGTFSPAEALSRLLTGTGLTYRFTGPNAVTLEPAPQATGGAIQLGPVRVEGGAGNSPAVAAQNSSDPDATQGSGVYTGSRTSAATRMALTVQETPQSVTIVTRERIDDFQLLTVDSVLTSVVGITENRTESNRGSFVSRGFTVSNFRVDGVEANYLAAGPGGITTSMQFDSYVYDRIEVVRGATGLLSPTGDPSATINLVRKKPGREFAAEGVLAAGNREFVRAGADLSVPITADGKLRTRLIGLYQHADSWRDRASDDKYLLSGVMEYDATPTTLVRLTASYEERDSRGPSYGSPPVYDTTGQIIRLPRSTNLAAEWSRWDQSQFRADLTVEQQLGDRWKLIGVVGRSIDRSSPWLAFLGIGTPDADGDGRSFNNYFAHAKREQWTYDLSLQGDFTLFGREHMLSLGANGYRQKDRRRFYNYENEIAPFEELLDGLGANIYDFEGAVPEFSPTTDPDTFSTTDIDMDGVFGSLRFSLADPLHLIVGGRFTNWRRSDDYSEPGYVEHSSYKPGRQFTPFAGVTFDIVPQLTAYASYADVFTPQNLRTVDNEIIDPIVGSNVEVGLKASLLDERLSINLAVYEAKLDNVAEMVEPEVLLPDGSSAYQSTGKGNRTRGFEIEVSGALTPRWNLYAGFADNRTELSTGERANTFRPRQTFKLQTMWQPPVLQDRLSIGGGVNWQADAYNIVTLDDDSELRVEQKAYALVSLAAHFDVTDRIAIAVNASNLFDKSYYTYPGFGYYGEPRTVRATANVRF